MLFPFLPAATPGLPKHRRFFIKIGARRLGVVRDIFVKYFEQQQMERGC
jgi:hypothetical protein